MSKAEDETMSIDETSSSSEDEEPEIDETQDKFFFKTLSCLKNKDPKIYDPEVVFFPKDELSTGGQDLVKERVKKKDSKPIFLRDYEREQVVKIMKGGEGDQNEDENEEDLPYVEQQKNLKANFKAALVDSESESEDDLLKVKTKTKEERDQEEEDYKAWLKGNKDKIDDEETEKDLKPLHDFWSKPDLDSNEQFLRDYILNRRYLEEGEEAEDDGISEDGELLEMQEKFETEYNLRFENETNTETKRYPRVIEGSLRKKDESRSEKRKKRLERKKLEKDKKKQEIAKKQKEKLLEFKEQVEKIKKLTGNDQLGFRDEEIFGDEEFDPDAHDKKMQELYSDAFYSADAEDVEKPDFGDDEDIAGPEDTELDLYEPGPDNMDLEAPGTSGKKSKKETRSKKKRKEKKKAFTDIMDIAKPVFDPEVHNSYQKYIDDYYGMDCEDFIEDIPCRFKYRETVPNDYGLSVEEILAADDKELNQWVSAKKITKLRPEHVEKNEVKVYKQKAKDYDLKKKILSSIYGSPEHEEEGEDDDDLIPNNSNQQQKTESKTTKKKKKRGLDDDQNDQPQPDSAPSNPNKKKKPNSEINGATDNSARKSKASQRKAHLNEQTRTTSAANSNKKKPNAEINSPTKSSTNKKNKLDQPKAHQNGRQKTKKFTRDKKNKRNSTGTGNNDPVAQVSDERLKAYDIKPREFKKKMKYKN